MRISDWSSDVCSSVLIRTRPTAPCQSVHAVPRILDRPGEIGRLLDGKRVVVFLDYDGTLTPIVARPDEAILSEGTRAAIKALARRCMVGIISGRDRAAVEIGRASCRARVCQYV